MGLCFPTGALPWEADVSLLSGLSFTHLLTHSFVYSPTHSFNTLQATKLLELKSPLPMIRKDTCVYREHLWEKGN